MKCLKSRKKFVYSIARKKGRKDNEMHNNHHYQKYNYYYYLIIITIWKLQNKTGNEKERLILLS